MLNLMKKTTITTLAALTLAGGLTAQANAQSSAPAAKGMSLQAHSGSFDQGTSITRARLIGSTIATRSSYNSSFNHNAALPSGIAYHSQGNSRNAGYVSNNHNDFGHDSFGNDRFSSRRFNDRNDFRHREISSQISYDHNFESAKLLRSRF